MFFLYKNMKAAPRIATPPIGAAIAMTVVFTCDEEPLELCIPPLLSTLWSPGVMDADSTAAGEDVAVTNVVGRSAA